MHPLRWVWLSLLAIFLATPGRANASGIPEDGMLDFAILRNGEQIGRHLIRFERRGEPTIVQITADVDYRVAFIPLYIFRHTARETWRAPAVQEPCALCMERARCGDLGSLRHKVTRCGNRRSALLWRFVETVGSRSFPWWKP